MTTTTRPQEYIGGPKCGDVNTKARDVPTLEIQNPTVGRGKYILGRFRYDLVGGDYRFIAHTE